MPSRKKGFTLIELLVVVAIIGLLATVVMVSLNSARVKGRDAKRMRDMHELRTAIELYISDYGDAPEVGAVSDSATGGWNLLAAELVPDYIPALPRDPCGNSCGDIYHYGYTSPSENSPESALEYGNTYGLEAILENGGPVIIGNTQGLAGYGSW